MKTQKEMAGMLVSINQLGAESQQINGILLCMEYSSSYYNILFSSIMQMNMNMNDTLASPLDYSYKG